MALTVTIADNADNTGATATISGSSAGTVTVYTLLVSGPLSQNSWVSSGSRTGNGTVSLSLQTGFYFVYAKESTTLTDLVDVRVTTGAESVVGRCVSAIATLLGQLDLPCTANIYDILYSNQPNLTYPCIVLTYEDARQTDEMTTNGRDDIGHPIRILVKDIVQKYDSAKRETYRSWQERIRRCFISQRLPGVVEIVRNKVEYGPVNVIDSSFPQSVLEIVVRAVTREVRGVGT